ncbi:MAG: hypothetical protein OHK0012_07290 [Synechococcales cyanobacterium]
MNTLGSRINDILRKQRLSWQEAKAINRLLLGSFPSDMTLALLQNLVQAIANQQVALDLSQHDYDITSSVRLWQLYLVNHSKTGLAPVLKGAAAACPLPNRAQEA